MLEHVHLPDPVIAMVDLETQLVSEIEVERNNDVQIEQKLEPRRMRLALLIYLLVSACFILAGVALR